MDETNILKIIGTVLLWLCMLIFGLLPIKLTNFRTNKTLLSLSNCFSGGLFIAIGLIHILPEARENLEGKMASEGEDVFPFSYVICLATFAFILFIDKVAFNNEDIADIDSKMPMDLHKSIFKQGNIENSVQDNFKELVSSKYKVALKLSALGNNKVCEHNDDDYHKIEEEEYEKQMNLVKSEIIDKEVVTIKSKSSNNKFHNIFDDEEDKKNKSLIVEEKDHKHEHTHSHGGDHHGHHHRMVTANDSFITAYILLLAMGIHGFFAGIAFGVAKTKTETLNMFIAMISHKWSEALTVGISFVSAEIGYKQSFYMLLFLSFITPIGILVGYLLSTMSDTIIGVALAVSSGTFIYISCAEIIIEEFAIARHKYLKFLFFIIGIVFIAFVGLLE